MASNRDIRLCRAVAFRTRPPDGVRAGGAAIEVQSMTNTDTALKKAPRGR